MKKSLREIVYVLLVVLLIIVFGYKVFERNMMKKVPLVFNETLTREMQMDSEGDQLYVKINEKEDKKEEFEGQKTEALYTYFELRGHTNLFASRQDEYIKMLEFNKSQFDTLLKWSKLIVGQRRRLLSQLITNQLKYYQDEIILARKHKLYQDLLFNIYLIKDDNSVLQNYMDKTSDQDVALGYYFDDLSVLHKYTQSDYKLRSEDEIAGIYPYSYEMLDKFRKYFSSIYSVAKDSASLDDESAMYKFSKVVDNYAELNIDQEQIGRENSEEDIGLNKEIVELFFKQFLIIEELNNSNLFNYPLVKNPSKFKRDLHLCRMYEYKSGLFRVITNRLPESETFEALAIELNELPPSTVEADNAFDRDFISFENTDNYLKFECKDKEGNKTFNFSFSKY